MNYGKDDPEMFSVEEYDRRLAQGDPHLLANLHWWSPRVSATPQQREAARLFQESERERRKNERKARTMADKPAIYQKLIDQMEHVRDELMPKLIIDEYRGSGSARAKLERMRALMNEAIDAIAERDEGRALEAFGELHSIK